MNFPEYHRKLRQEDFNKAIFKFSELFFTATVIQTRGGSRAAARADGELCDNS